MVTSVMQDGPVKVRHAWPSNRVLGTLGIAFAPMLAVEGAVRAINHTSTLQSTPLTSTLGLLYLIGWAASAIGLRQLRTTGSGGLAVAVFVTQMIGLALAACQQIGELSHHLPPPDSIRFMAIDMAWPLSHIYMIVVGAVVITARVFSGWQKFIPLACGLTLPLSMLVQAIGGRTAMEISFGILTTLCFASLGYAVRSSPRGRERRSA